MSSQGTPRKFSEKIAIMERKQNEDQEAFTSIMRDVRSITSNSHRPQPAVIPSTNLAPPILYNRNSTSLPNVSDTNYYWPLCSQPHQLLLQQQQQQQLQQPSLQSTATATAGAITVACPSHPCRSRSPGAAAHYHPYKHAPTTVVSERSPPMDYSRMECSNHHLQPPELFWQKACSDPAIHTYNDFSAPQSINDLVMNPTALQAQNQSVNQEMQSIQQQQQQSLQMRIQQQQTPLSANASTSPVFISPPQRRPEEILAGSLPNMMPGPSPPPYNYHQPISQRHSMGVCQTLAAPSVMNESISAPTSPQQTYDVQPISTYSARNYSTSPESLTPIPDIVLTSSDGSYGGYRDARDMNDGQQVQRDLQQDYLLQQMHPSILQQQPGGAGENGELHDLRRELQNCDLNQCNPNRIDPQCERTIF
uniref:TORC_N domain-containing protein n=1 Tax=Syphacia muris TaxID=451379 RepID=A0A0N5AFN1_9BILA